MRRIFNVNHFGVRVFYLLLLSECLFFSYIYFVDVYGKKGIRSTDDQTIQIQQEIEVLHTEIMQYQKELDDWKNNSFYKEKYAREQLQMARPGDIVYYVP